MVAGDGLLRLFLRDLVSLGGDERNKLDTTLDKKISGLLGKRDAACRGKDLGNYLLYRGYTKDLVSTEMLRGGSEENMELGIVTTMKDKSSRKVAMNVRGYREGNQVSHTFG